MDDFTATLWSTAAPAKTLRILYLKHGCWRSILRTGHTLAAPFKKALSGQRLIPGRLGLPKLLVLLVQYALLHSGVPIHLFTGGSRQDLTGIARRRLRPDSTSLTESDY